MSLDVSLWQTTDKVVACPHCGGEVKVPTAKGCVYEANITHNLIEMAREAGIYEAVWRPKENGYTLAGHLVAKLRDSIAFMAASPTRFKMYDAPNGWGTYGHFLLWLRKYLAACEEHSDAEVRASG